MSGSAVLAKAWREGRLRAMARRQARRETSERLEQRHSWLQWGWSENSHWREWERRRWSAGRWEFQWSHRPTSEQTWPAGPQQCRARGRFEFTRLE